jgi:hypothetical protein
MASANSDKPPAHIEDWEEIQPSESDDIISIVSESEETGPSNQDFVEIDHPKKTKYPGRMYSDPNDEPVGPLPTLRRVLYDLKDTLKDSIAQLEDFNQEANMTELSLSGPIMQTQQRQVDTLNFLLTNAATDWEGYAANGGMTFDDFANLDPVPLHELDRLFKTFVIEVKERNGRARPSDADVEQDQAEEEEDVGWLDFILPAIDEVSSLLRVPEQDHGVGDVFGSYQTESVREKQQVAEASKALEHEESEFAAVGTSTRQPSNNDDKIHEKMMMVSDW